MKILGMDDYDLQARLAPALLAVLPGALIAGVWTAKAWTVVTGTVTGLGAAVALAFLLAQLARSAGKRVEQDMVRRLGGMPTTLALRHDGPELNPYTRSRYHKFLSAKLGRAMPTEAEQASNPQDADARFQSAVDWLRKHAVDEKDSLVRAELMAYGFCRNLAGLRPVALIILLICIALNGTAIFYAQAHKQDLMAAGVLEVLLCAALFVWLFVGPRFVEAAAWAYARRLLSLCEGRTVEKSGNRRSPSPA